MVFYGCLSKSDRERRWAVRTEELRKSERAKKKTVLRVALPCPDVGEAVTARVFCREEKRTAS